MCRVWSLILMICIIYQINQTDPTLTHTGGGYKKLSHEQEAQPRKSTTSTSRNQDLARPLLGQGGEPSRATTEHPPPSRKKPTTEHSATPLEEVPYEKLENAPRRDTSSSVAIVLGLFHPEKGKTVITEEECKPHCKTHFGHIISKGERIDMAIPKLINGDIVCRCELNTERLEPILKSKDKKHKKPGFSDFINDANKNRYGKFCAAKHWLSEHREIHVEIGYELGAKNRKPSALTSDGETSSTVSTRPRHRTPGQTPDRTFGSDSSHKSGVNTRHQTPNQTPDRTFGSTSHHRAHHQDANRTPNRNFDIYSVSPGDSTTDCEHDLLGTFTSKGEAFTLRSCANRCLHTFGQLLEEDLQRWHPITKGKLSRDGKTCDCLLFKDTVRIGCSYLRKRQIQINCDKLIQVFLNFNFCEGKLHAQENHLNIVLGYEYDAVPHRDKKYKIHPLEEVPSDHEPEEAPARRANGDKNIVFKTLEKKTRNSLFTVESCTKECNTLFGFVILIPGGERTTFTEGRLSGDGTKCECFLNYPAFEKRLVEIKKKIKEEDKQEDRKAFNMFLAHCTATQGYKWAVEYFTTRPELKVTVEIGTAIGKSDLKKILEDKKKKDEDYAKKLIDGKLKMATFTQSSARGAFLGKITLDKCYHMCNSKFGWIRAPKNIPFTSPKLSEDELSCECWFNTEKIEEHLIAQAVSWSSFVAHLEKGYERAVKYLADYEPTREEEEDKSKFWELLGMPEEAKEHRKPDENNEHNEHNNPNKHGKPDEHNKPNKHDRPKHGDQKPKKNWPHLHIYVVDEKDRPKVKGQAPKK